MIIHNWPHQSTTFIGRSRELAEIGALLADPSCRLLTLLGPGGIGKSRLALQAAADQSARFTDGATYVPLAAVGSPDLLTTTLFRTFQLPPNGSDDLRVQLIRFLIQKNMLLVMDNIEHLLDGVDLLTEILQAAANVKFLITSRERLNVQEEWVFAVDGLRFPEDHDSAPLESYSAVQLFVQRARQVQASFSLDQNSEAVKAICQCVEGMPLALELAATWLRVMSCRQISVQIASSLDFLATPYRNMPERHRSLRAVFEQSWSLLSQAEQEVLKRLSLFRGGFDLESAEQVAGATLSTLAGLTDKSLIRLNADERYDLHELLRQFASDKLSGGETSATADRHLAYFLKLAEQAGAHNFGWEQIPWYDRIEIELDNLRTALAWSVQNEEAETGLRIAAALGWFLSERGHWNEGIGWLEKLLELAPDAPPSLRSKALHSAGALAGFLEDAPRVRLLCSQAFDLARAANDRWNMAWSLSHWGLYGGFAGAEQSSDKLDESLALFRELGDPMGICHTLIRQNLLCTLCFDFSNMTVRLEEVSPIAEAAGDKIILGWVPFSSGVIAWLRDHDFRQALHYFENALVLFREARFMVAPTDVLQALGFIEHSMGNEDRAQAYFEQALLLRHEMVRKIDVPLAGLANIALAQGQLTRAARLLAGVNLPDYSQQIFPELQTVEQDIASLREKLGEAAFVEAWAEGKAMSREQMTAYALQTDLPSANPAHPAASQPLSEALSFRELEVLRLIVAGASNQEIANQLVIGVSTVKKHVNHIFGKLGVESRTQAVAQARALNLL